jgi:hypothetical protein
MIFDWLKYIVHHIPWVAFLGWMGLLVSEHFRASPRIEALRKKHDPRGDFIVEQINNRTYGFTLNKNHPLCTQQFLKEWNRVYNGHLRRMVVGGLLLPVVGYGSQFLRSLIERTFFQ